MTRFFSNIRWSRLAIIIAIAVVAICLADVASACPTCKDSVAQNDPQYQSMARGYYYSILFMLSMPFVIVTAFGTFAYRAYKQAEVQRSAATTPSTAAPLTVRR
jgi:uncharacterized membrane protein